MLPDTGVANPSQLSQPGSRAAAEPKLTKESKYLPGNARATLRHGPKGRDHRLLHSRRHLLAQLRGLLGSLVASITFTKPCAKRVGGTLVICELNADALTELAAEPNETGHHYSYRITACCLRR